MIAIEKKIVRDAEGNPREVIISWEDYQNIIELLGLDLDEDAISDLMEARRDRESGNKDAYVRLDAV